MLAVLLLNRMSMKRRIARKQRISKVVKVDVKVPEVVYCRTCLGTEDLESIFTNKEQEKKRSHDLKLVTGLEIKINDGLSQKICNKCVDIVKTALQFRRTSKRAEKSLLGMVSGEKQKKKCKLRKKVSKSHKIREPKQETYDVEFEYDVGDDFQNDEYGDDNGFEGDNYDDEEYEKTMQELMEPNVCEEKGKSKPGVKKKRQVMANAPPYKCSTCNKDFRMKATYKAHMRFHTNYCVCETCGKRCRNNNQLQEHKRARHGLGRIHKCAYCEYSSATKEALTIHERRHTGERPYVCDHCGATFHRRSNLVQHIAIHLPEKNFQCSMCDKREKSKKLLQVHEYKAHRQKKYKYTCPVCRDVFTRPGNVRHHLIRSHGVPRHDQGPIERFEMETEVIGDLHMAVRSAFSASSQRDEDLTLPLLIQQNENYSGAAGWCDSIEVLYKEFNWKSNKTSALGW